MNIEAENLQDIFNETMEETLTDHQNKAIQEAEEMAYEELKPNYLSQLISRYKYMVRMTAALKKGLVHQRIMRTAKRLREDDYDDDESMQYAIKKRKFLIERKLDEYDPPSYEEDEEQAQTQSLPYKAPLNIPPYKPTDSKTIL